jgi:cation diffusion facilitator CzcD-associated flavoprotein CzcO
MSDDDSGSPASATAAGFDPDALRRRYDQERDKRLRTDGNDQYLAPSGDLAYFDVDPYADPTYTRPPITDAVDVIIVGGGFAGLLAGAKIRERGDWKIRIVERGSDFGGTWYWNRYPGAQCDVESYIYLPLLDETGYIPTEKYVKGPEIRAYAQQIGRHFRLYDDACLQTQVTGIGWDNDTQEWTVSTTFGDRLRARFVVLTGGLLSRPKLPAIRGIETFKGHMFHTSRWDYNYTAGDSSGGMTGLADKRVGIVGTGATAIQIVPQLGEWAQHLYVFQRTPSTINERNNKPTDPEWVRSLSAGWQARRMQNFNILVTGGHQDVDLVADAWTDVFHNLQAFLKTDDSDEDPGVALEMADFMKMESLRARIDSIVNDRATAEALKPWYRLHCKRPCFSDNYLPTFNRPSVTLVDTDGQGVREITSHGVVVKGQEYELDCLIFATGFEVGTDYVRRQGYDITGRDGLRLSEKWSNGVRSFHGFSTHDFPNLLFMGVTQTGITPNVPHMLRKQAEHIAYLLERCLTEGIDTIETTEEAEEAWGREMHEHAKASEAFRRNCTPGYINNEGRETPHAIALSNYGLGPEKFFQLLENWRERGDLNGFELKP